MLTGIGVALGRWELGGSFEPASVRERPVATLCKVADCGRLRHALPATASAGRTLAVHGRVACCAAPAPHGSARLRPQLAVPQLAPAASDVASAHAVA